MLAGVYSRQSHDSTASIEQQETEGLAECDREGWTVHATYRDGVSASRFARAARSEWPRALADIDAGHLGLLWLWESSRGDRDAEQWLGLLRRCRDRGVLIHIHRDRRTYDMSVLRDWRTLAEDGIDSQVESERTSQRVLRGVRAKAIGGRPHGRNQYGYVRHYDDRTGELVRVTEDPGPAAVIREAARRVLASETTYAIARDFNARGVPTPRGGRWTVIMLRRLLGAPLPDGDSGLAAALREADRRVRAGEPESVVAKDFRARGVPAPAGRWGPEQIARILTNPSYAGKRVHRGEVVGAAVWPAILDDVTFTVLCARLQDPALRLTRPAAVVHLLSGIARCGRCGGRMRVLRNRGSLAYTCCDCYRVSRIKSKVDALVEAAVVAFLSRDDAAEVLAAADPSGEVAEALDEAAEKRARLAGFYDVAARGELTPAGLARIEASLLAEIRAAERRARRIVVAPVLEQVVGADAEQRWAGLSIPQRREVITALMRVRILPQGRGQRIFDPRGVEITWSFHGAAGDG